MHKKHIRRDNARVVMMGDPGVGKSSIVDSLMGINFEEGRAATIGASYYVIQHNGKKLNLWDTAGQERFANIMPMYYRSADVIVLVFDLKEPQSLTKINSLLGSFKEEMKKAYKCIIIGNKTDLMTDDSIKLTDTYVKVIIEKNKDIVDKYIYYSAKSPHNRDQLKEIIFKLLVETEVQNEMNEIEENANTIILNGKNNNTCANCTNLQHKKKVYK